MDLSNDSEADDDFPISEDFCQNRTKLSTSHDQSYVVTVDSGYGSSYNVTPLTTPNVSSSLISISSPQRGSKSATLITIPEGSDKVRATPVAQNILKLTKFHITTPQSCSRAIGVKRHTNTLLTFEGLHSTPKKLRINPESKTHVPMPVIEYTSRHLRRSHVKKKLFRREFKSVSDLNSDQEDEFGNVSISNRSDLSPIAIKDPFREKRTPLSDANINYLKSSTPKVYGCSYNSSAVNVTTNFTTVKKALSFADQCISKQSQQLHFRIDDNLLTHKFATPNKKILLLKENVHFSTGSVYKPTYINQEENFRKHNKIYRVLNSASNGGEIIQHCAIEASHSCLEGSSKSKNRKLYVHFGAAEGSLEKFDSKTVFLQHSAFHDIVNIVPTCDMENAPLKPSFLENPPLELEWTFEIGSNLNFKSNFNFEPNQFGVECDSINNLKLRTPRLEMEKRKGGLNEKFGFLPNTPKKQKLSIKQEQLDILYPKMPRTPSKRSCTKNLTKRKTERESQFEKQFRKFYNGITQLNIISKLESYTLVLDKIFELLSSEDIFNFACVSKSWKKIVQLNSKANARLKIYMNEWKQCKENDEEYKIFGNITSKKDALFRCQKNDKTTRVPFSQHNKNELKRSLDEHKSPPVSPSKRKFYENQKVVRTLADKEKLTKCPRCKKSSRIISSPFHNFSKIDYGNNSSNLLLKNGANILTKQFEAFQATWNICCSLTSSSDNTFMSHSSYNKTSCRPKLRKAFSADLGVISKQALQSRSLALPFYPFGECSGLACKFRFCLECFCEYHPGTHCKLSEPASPSKEDQQNGALQINSSSASRNFKSRRKSLKRLCF